MKQHKVKCLYCKQEFDANKEEYVMARSNRYAHAECHKQALVEKEEKEKKQNELHNLYDYICLIFKTDYVNPRIKKQIEDYVKQYNFTYTGILRALIYSVEVKRNPIEKMNGGIGIVPYIYKEAENYYFYMQIINNKNEGKQIELYAPKQREVYIKEPKREKMIPSSFSFLDEEE